jgi:hypothetical protein
MFASIKKLAVIVSAKANIASTHTCFANAHDASVLNFTDKHLQMSVPMDESQQPCCSG